MVEQFLKMGGCKTPEEFYKKYPTEDAFFEAFPQAVKYKKGGEAFPQTVTERQFFNYGQEPPQLPWLFECGGTVEEIFPQATPYPSRPSPKGGLPLKKGGQAPTEYTKEYPLQRKEAFISKLQTTAANALAKNLRQEISKFTNAYMKSGGELKKYQGNITGSEVAYDRDTPFEMYDPFGTEVKGATSGMPDYYYPTSYTKPKQPTYNYYPNLGRAAMNVAALQGVAGFMERIGDQRFNNTLPALMHDSRAQSNMGQLNRGDYDMLGTFSPDQLINPQYAKYGGQSRLMQMVGKKGNQIAPWYIPDSLNQEDISVRETLQPVDRSEATIEAEKGETVVIPNIGGLLAHFDIAGQMHYDGGTPLNVPDGSYVFSVTKNMKIKDPEILKLFGETKPKTPAEIAKKYKINKYRESLQDPKADKIQVETAEDNIKNANYKLAMLALVQESMKGYPNGIPEIAQAYLETANVDPNLVLPEVNPMASFGQAGPVDPNQIPSRKYGGGLQKYQQAGEVLDQIRKYFETINSPQRAVDAYSPLIDPIPLDNSSRAKRGNFAQGFREKIKNVAYPVQDSITSAQPYSGAISHPGFQNNPNQDRGQATISNTGISSDGMHLNAPKTKGALPSIRAGKTGEKIWDEEYDTRWIPLVEQAMGNKEWAGKIYEALQNYDNPEFPDAVKEVRKRMEEDPRGWETRVIEEATDKDVGPFHRALWDIIQQTAPEDDPAAEAPADPAKEKTEAPAIDAGKIGDDTVLPTGYGYAPFWEQDRLTVANAMRANGRIRKFNPHLFSLQPVLPEPTYLSPERELAANASQANTAMQAMGAFAGPQALSSRASSISGEAAKNAADITGRYANANVNIANTFAQNKAAILNEYGAFNAEQQSNFLDKLTIANQQFINAKNQAGTAITDGLRTALTNRAKAQTLNELYPQYHLDPATGGLVHFTKGKNIPPIAPKDDQFLRDLADYQTLFPGRSLDEIAKLMKSHREGYQEQSDAHSQFLAAMGLIGQ